MDEMTSGFFDTWKTFVSGTLFSAENSDYGVDDLGAQYRLSYLEGSSHVLETLTKDFAMRDLNISAPEFQSSI